jgi:L-fuculose-phosphate aldolase
MGARPPNVMAFAVTDTAFDPRTIPESYIMLRSVRKESFESVYNSQDDLGGIAEKFSPQMPVLICENDQVIATGSSLLNVFDRMEVAEATARSIIAAKDIGPLVKISDKEADEINKAFNLD